MKFEDFPISELTEEFNWFQIGAYPHEALSLYDFRNDTIFENAYFRIDPSLDLVLGIPIENYLMTIKIFKDFIEYNFFLVNWLIKNEHFRSPALPCAPAPTDVSWVRPAIFRSEVIAHFDAKRSPIFANVFIIDEECSENISFCHVAYDHAFCLTFKKDLVKPKKDHEFYGLFREDTGLWNQLYQSPDAYHRVMIS